LIIYEIGAGNGTLMLNILDYLLEHEPEIYETCRYTVVEISPLLVKAQLVEKRHVARVDIVNKSVFDWDKKEEEACFVMAHEVIDNFAHDVLRREGDELLQGIVLIDGDGDYTEAYETVSDPLLLDYLEARPIGDGKGWKETLKYLLLPWATTLGPKEFVPTMQFEFLRVLTDKFPKHRLLLSDFDVLPDAIEVLLL
jgi:hypothetical protein